MSASVPFQATGYHTVTPCLTVADAPRLIAFIERAFGGRETERLTRPDGTIGHAEVRIGDAVVMLSEVDAESPLTLGALYTYVADTDQTYTAALAAGAVSLMEPRDTFYGDRNAGVIDPCGNRWWIATHLTDVATADLQRRADAASARPA